MHSSEPPFLSLGGCSIERMFDMMEAQGIEVGAVPDGLDEMRPGPILGAFLAAIEVDTLSGYDRVVVLRAHQRMVSHHTAHLYEDMASVSSSLAEIEDDPMWVGESASAEIRAALTLTRRAADIEYGFARDLDEDLPRVRDALAAGVIDLRRAKTIVYGVAHLPPDTARGVVDRIIDQAPQLTSGELAAKIRRLCIETDPDEAAQRYDETVADRRVVSRANPTGTANLLGLDMAPHRVTAAMRRINRLARSFNAADDPRTLDQIRADVALDLLCGTSSGARGSADAGVVDIRVDLDTLARLTDHPGELAGYGPVIADIARRAAEDQPDTEWRYTITDPATGGPICDGTTRRRPTTSQRRTVEARNPTCVFPGCRMPATGCDLNHRIPWSHGGPTSVDTLDPLCRHDHVIHHNCSWRYERLSNGDFRWISRLGRTYTTSGTPP